MTDYTVNHMADNYVLITFSAQSTPYDKPKSQSNVHKSYYDHDPLNIKLQEIYLSSNVFLIKLCKRKMS